MSDASARTHVLGKSADETVSAVSKFSVSGCAKSIAAIVGLILFFPFSLAVTLAAFVVKSFAFAMGGGPMASNGKTVMLSGGKMTKALQLARLFHRAGYRVVLCETDDYRFTGHRFSNSVDRFEIVPRCDVPNYADVLCEIAKQSSADFYVPVCSPYSSYFDSQAKHLLEQQCKVIHVSSEHIATLDNKFLFAEASKIAGLLVPQTVLITDVQQVLDFDFSSYRRPFILKSIAYDPVRRLDMTKLPMESADAMRRHLTTLPISESNPWILQEFIAGREFCTHSTVINGEVRVHVCCQSSAFQVNYDPVDEPLIEQWIETFCESLNPTGQLSFDFIQANDDGQFYAIECNPRTHSAITTFYANDDVADAWFSDQFSGKAVGPASGNRPTYWIAHEICRISAAVVRFDFLKAAERFRIVLHGKEAVFDWRDPMPFLMLHHYHVPALLINAAIAGRDWLRIDFNIGKLVRAGGD
ncbi:MAG: ATP-grasp enzyme [Planctomycetota bacterium]